MDAGLRVTEAVSLRFENLRFREKLIRVKSLKKRKEEYRDIPMTARLMEAMASYLGHYKGNREDGNSWLFPGLTTHLKRSAVWRFYNRIAKRCPRLACLHPHVLRHTFATRLVTNDVSLLTAKELLGHSSVQTTEIYTHIPAQVLKSSIEKLAPQQSRLVRMLGRLLGKKKPQVIRIGKHEHQSILIGREVELSKLQDLTDKFVNVLVKGGQGVGKSQLLDNLKIEGRKMVRLDVVVYAFAVLG